MNTIVNKRKLAFTDIINEGLKIFFFKFKDVFLLLVLLFVPFSFLNILFAENISLETNSATVVSVLLAILLLLVQFIIGLISAMSIAVIMEKVVENQTISLLEAVKFSVSKCWRAFTTSLLASLIVMGLTILLVIPGVIYWTYYIFVLYAVALRDKHGKEALNYSKILVVGQWWRVFGVLMGLGILFAIFNGIITYPLNQISENPYFAVVPNMVTLFLSAIFGAMNVVFFLNNDYVYHQKLTSTVNKERPREIRKAPTVEEFLSSRERKTKVHEPSISKKTVSKTKKKTTKKTSTTTKHVAKKNTIKKDINTVRRKPTS